jgi:hypothetical protein
MVIGITLNEVVRDFIGQLAYTYNKYEYEGEGDLELKEDEVTNWNLLEFFPFKDEYELKKFLYTEASLEVFGHADQLHENVITKLNRFMDDISDEEEHEILIISREGNKSIPATLFFLSKLGFRGDNLRFVKDTSKKWDYVDVLITANPKALAAKPEGKISVKVNASYNKDSEADFEVDNIIDIFDNEENFYEIVGE